MVEKWLLKKKKCISRLLIISLGDAATCLNCEGKAPCLVPPGHPGPLPAHPAASAFPHQRRRRSLPLSVHKWRRLMPTLLACPFVT